VHSDGTKLHQYIKKCWDQEHHYILPIKTSYKSVFFSLIISYLNLSNFEEFYVRFEVFAAVTMKNAVFWDVVACRFCVNRRFGGTYRLNLQGRKIRERGTSVSRWLQSVHTRSTRHHIPEDGIRLEEFCLSGYDAV
jgi:hypothetical protein